jgi:DNA-binding MarR family transcriptional regulator
MDDLLFGLKRAHLAGNRWALGLLAKFGLTPARFDVLRMLFSRRDHAMSQVRLRERLGVARSTVSRMLRSLERHGWVERKTYPFDRRGRWCALTHAGRELAWRVLSELVRPRLVADALDEALRSEPASSAVDRTTAEWFCLRVVYRFARPDGVLTVRLDDA